MQASIKLKEDPEKLVPAFTTLTKLRKIENVIDMKCKDILAKTEKAIKNVKDQVNRVLEEFYNFSLNTCPTFEEEMMEIKKTIKEKRMKREQEKIVKNDKPISRKPLKQLYYKCQCSKFVMVSAEQFIKKHGNKKCMSYQKYNSHFIIKNEELVLNEKIDQKILEQLFILQNEVYHEFYLCGCGQKQTLFFCLSDFRQHLKVHKTIPFSSRFCSNKHPIQTNLKINKWKIESKKRQLEEACFSLDKTEDLDFEPAPIKLLSRNTKYKANLDNLNVFREVQATLICSDFLKRKYVFCDACKIFLVTKADKSRDLAIRRHFQLHKTNKCLKFSTIEDQYKILLQKIKRKEFNLIKCQCSKTLFPDLLSYKEHVDTFHQGIALQLSSHLYIQKQFLPNNIISIQALVQSQLIPDCYRCGNCSKKTKGYFTNEDEYLAHLVQNHSHEKPHKNHSHWILNNTQKNSWKDEEEYKFLKELQESFKGPYYCMKCKIKNITKSELVQHVFHERNHWAQQDFIFIRLYIDRRVVEILVFPLKDQKWMQKNGEKMVRMSCHHASARKYVTVREFIKHLQKEHFQNCLTYLLEREEFLKEEEQDQ